MRRLYIFAILCLSLWACTEAEIAEQSIVDRVNGIPKELFVSLENDADTRIELNDELKSVWTGGDMVTVFYKSDANNRFAFKGSSGDRSGVLERETSYAGESAMESIVAIYPYSADYVMDAATESVTMSIGTEQHYNEASYGLGDNIMAYRGASDSFYMQSVCGWLRVSLTGAQRVKSLRLSGNNGEQLAGDATLDCNRLELDFKASSDASLRTLTLDCGDGVRLSPAAATEFYFVVAPQTFTEGITIEVVFDDGSTVTKSTSKSVTINRNHIQPMAAIDMLDESIDAASMPLITTYPKIIYEDATEDVIVLVNAKGTAMANYTGQMYAHTGLITANSTSNSDWKYVKAGWGVNTEACKLVNRGNNIWQFTIKGGVRSFYGVSGNDEIESMAFVFRSSDGTKEIKSNGSDILIGVSKSGAETEQLISTVPLDVDEDTTQDVVITLNVSGTVMDGFAGPIYAHTGVLTSKSTSTSDWRYVKADWSENSEACRLTNIGDNRWQLVITGGPRAFYGVPASESIEYLCFVFRSADGGLELKTQGNDILVYVKNDLQRRPLGASYGVTVSGTTATFVLYAPGKQRVNLLGDFNNYQATSSSLMNKDGDYFWYTIEDLQPGVEYGYQYLVDGTTRIGDPYAEKILDPWNDRYISSTTYPHLKSYPSGASEIVSTFELMPEPYDWSVPNFDRPAKNSLAIYELHLRDFTTQGTIQAAIDRLDHLQKLGINAIELMPIQEFDGNDSWGYNTCFYFAPDKAYGTKEDYQRFIDECHKRGIAVIMDVVINHATGQFPYAKMWWDSYNNCTTDANPFFNRIARHPYSVYHDFNHEYGETRTYFKRMLKFWLEEYKVDGFRFDLSKGLTQKDSGTSDAGVGAWSCYDSSRIAIIKDYADAIRSISDDAYIILEHFADWSEENELANYRDILLWNNQCEPFYQTVMGYSSNSDFGGDIAYGRVSYFESHDEERNAYKAVTYGQSWVKGDWSRISKQLQGAYCLHFLAPYPKMMWQFGELGYDYSIEYNGRTGKKPVKWDYLNNSHRLALYNAVSKAITWRTEHEAMYSHDSVSCTYNVGDGDFGGKHLIYSTAQGSVIVVCNFGNSHVSFDLTVPVTGTWQNLMTGERVTLGSKYNVSLAAGDYIVLVR